MSVPHPTSQRTTAQIVFLHTAESALFSALLTVGVGVVQYLATHSLDWGELGAIVATLFVGQMSMVYKSLMVNPNTAQAISDTETQLASTIVHVDVSTLATQLRDELIKISQQPPQPPQPPQATPDMPTKPMPTAKTQPKAG